VPREESKILLTPSPPVHPPLAFKQRHLGMAGGGAREQRQPLLPRANEAATAGTNGTADVPVPVPGGADAAAVKEYAAPDAARLGGAWAGAYTRRLLSST